MVAAPTREQVLEKGCVELGCRQEAFGNEAPFLVLPASLGLTRADVKAETSRHVESCVPINTHFAFPLPGSSVDLKVLMKTMCLQKGFLSWVCYHKNSTQRLYKPLKQILFQR